MANLLSRIESAETAIGADQPPYTSYAERRRIEESGTDEQRAALDARIAAYNAWLDKKNPGMHERLVRQRAELRARAAACETQAAERTVTGVTVTSPALHQWADGSIHAEPEPMGGQLVSSLEGPQPHTVKHTPFVERLSLEALDAELAELNRQLNADKLAPYREDRSEARIAAYLNSRE